MTTNAAQFTGDIPKNYNDGLGPVIFHPYAEDLTARAVALAPDMVLELAAGTGIVTRKLRDALPSSVSLLATDLNDAMLEIARPLFADDENISFEVVDAMSIPKEDSSFDLIVAQFGIMFVPDKVASLKEARRVLKPGGTYLFNVWDSWQGNPWAGITQNAVDAVFPGEAPAFYKVPFHYHDPDAIRRDLEAAGFDEIDIKHVKKDGRVTSYESLSYAAVFGNPLADEIRALNTDVTPEDAQQAVLTALEETFGPAPAHIPLSAFVISARNPA
jgi:ubiquinone/menaquinone biosynthesis C-methylase UbiE